MGYELAVAELTKRIGAHDAERALVIEDSLAGIEAGQSARLVCFAVGHSYPEAALKQAGADTVIPRIRDADDDLIDALYHRLYR